MPISKALEWVQPRFRTPWVATMFVGICGAILCAQSSLIAVVTFTLVLIILYGLIDISALVSRFRHRAQAQPFKTALWPVPRLIALVGVGFALSQQKSSDLVICAAIFGGGLIYYLVFLMPRRGRCWTHTDERRMA
ncbi:MAG: hypothetical protein M3071_25535 [Actinomycetota bacterium]|nr:hypothetical protein [Actinomycetota bacterium]